MNWWVVFILSLVGQDDLLEPDPWISESVMEQTNTRFINMEGCQFTLRTLELSTHIHMRGVDCPTPKQMGNLAAEGILKEWSR